MPFLPTLPVLPDLWTQSSALLGGSICITRSTKGMSRPRAATLVAIRHLTLPSLNSLKATYLLLCSISPWRRALRLIEIDDLIQFIGLSFGFCKYNDVSVLAGVEVNDIANGTLIVLWLMLPSEMQRCSMVIEVFIYELWIRSTIFLCLFMNFVVSSFTQEGIVAENNSFWTLVGELRLTNSRIFSTSSWKPCLSI